MKSQAGRVVIIGVIILGMCLPLGLIGTVINERAQYSRETVRNLGEEWGGAQRIQAIYLKVPVTQKVTRQREIKLIDPVTGLVMRNDQGNILYDTIDEIVEEPDDPLFLLPEKLNSTIDLTSEVRARGIFEVPVFRADTGHDFRFNTESAAASLSKSETPIWDQAALVIDLRNNKSLRGEVQLSAGEVQYPLSARIEGTGLETAIGDPRELGDLRLDLDFQGAKSLMLAPVGGETHVVMTSDWPHPSFNGSFLPDQRTISDAGFSAEWIIPHVARSVPQVTRFDPEHALRKHDSFGLTFYEPNDLYKKAYRVGRYAVLFIALTFLTLFLIERSSTRQVHPVQYIFIGLAQAMFVLLVLSFAEHLGFASAYALASAFVIGLISAYGHLALELGRKVIALCGMLVLLYAVLYMILLSADYALLFGTVLCFAALSATMFVTRDADWGARLKELQPELPRRKSDVTAT